MRLARIEHDGLPRYAVVEAKACRLIDGDILGRWQASDRTVPLDEAKWLAPIQPRQIIAIGLNYREHAAETGDVVPNAPVVFIKATSSLNHPGKPILLPVIAPDEVDYEAELVIVIGKRAKHVSEAEALDYVLGYTCGNDVSARDCQLRIDRQWARGKSFDTFAPIGPWIETDVDPDNLPIELLLNGRTMQKSNTSDMIFSCAHVVSHLSRCMTLEPGCVMMTGTPPGVGEGRKPKVFLRDGDTVTVRIGGIGDLTNPVRRERV